MTADPVGGVVDAGLSSETARRRVCGHGSKRSDVAACRDDRLDHVPPGATAGLGR